jgi:murein DD-endopeptidase MepM/ murein hydrolase activator NlpD
MGSTVAGGIGKQGGGMGMAGMLALGMSKMMSMGILNSVAAKANISSGYLPGRPGQYGDTTFDAEQLRNAATIASIGSQLAMSIRDIEIGIMTAITESGLRNLKYGDRDSLGLFQQRPSAGWGTPEQVTDPEYAAKKFFNALKNISGREDMVPWMAAQAVQRSAYSDGSNYQPNWNEATAIYQGLNVSSYSGRDGYKPGRGGMHRPIHGPVTSGIHDAYTGYPAYDFAGPEGRRVYAVGDGRISRSYDIAGPLPSDRYHDARYGPYGSYGRVIYEQLDSGAEVLFAHLKNRFVEEGTRVLGGSVIGLSGSTGNSSGPHLHFGASDGPGRYVGLRRGAHILSDGAANLHKRETVLTAPLSKDLKEGIGNLASGGGDEYNITVVATDGMDVEQVANKVMEKIRFQKGRTGLPKKVTGNND